MGSLFGNPGGFPPQAVLGGGGWPLSNATLTQLVQGLFSNGQPGGMWDLGDPGLVFGGGQGTVPNPPSGQSIGFAIDLSQQRALGPVLVPTAVTVTSGSVVDNGNGTYTMAANSSIAFLYDLADLGPGGATFQIDFTASLASGAVVDWNNVLGLAVGNGPFRFYSQRSVYDATFRYLNFATVGGGSSLTFTVPVVRRLFGNHLFQLTSASRPIFRDVAGRRYSAFDGVDDWLRAAFTIAQPIERISAIKPVIWAIADRLLGSVTAGQGATLYQTVATPQLSIHSGTVLGAMLATLNVPWVITERHDGASSRCALNRDAYTTGNAGTVVPGGITIGANDVGTQAGNIEVSRIVMREGLMTDAEIALCQAWCAAGAGVIL